MSWLNNVVRDFTITCGDGVKYKPNWLRANRQVDYNVAEFMFKGVSGSLVKRNLPIGTRYNLEIYFQGENNLVTATNFMQSAANNKAWQIEHPMYGPLFVQPLGMYMDDSDYNVTKVTSQVIETIGAARVKIQIDPIDEIKVQKFATDITMSEAYAVNVPDLLTVDSNAMRANVSLFDRLQLAYANTTDAAESVRNAYYKANALIDNTFATAFDTVASIQNLANLPANFVYSIQSRVDFLTRQLAALQASIEGITLPRLKRLYENNAGTVVGAICVATVTDIRPSDYRNRVQVVQVIDTVLAAYNGYITNLNTLQTDTGDTPDSYVPDYTGQTQLNTLVKFTVSNLFNIAANAKQQREYIVPNDTNPVLLAYQFYGLTPDDSTITQVIDENSIGINELLLVRKGKKLVYYV